MIDYDLSLISQDEDIEKYVMLYAIWYHLCDLKNVKNTHGGVLLLVKLQALASKGLFVRSVNDQSTWIKFLNSVLSNSFRLTLILDKKLFFFSFLSLLNPQYLRGTAEIFSFNINLKQICEQNLIIADCFLYKLKKPPEIYEIVLTQHLVFMVGRFFTG